jgi:cytochrome P450
MAVTVPSDWDPLSEASQRDPVTTDGELRRTCPVAYSDAFGGFWSVFRHEDIVRVARDTETFVSAPAISVPWDTDSPTPWVPLAADPPLHRWFRRVINPFFLASRLTSFEPQLDAMANQLVDGFADHGRVEFVEAFALPFPASAICMLLGRPASDWKQLADWTHETMVAIASGATDDVRRVRTEMADYCNEWMALRRAEPTDDVMSAMLAADIDGRPMTEHEIHGMFMLLAEAGHETTANSISSSMHHLATHPEQRDLLAAEPERIPGVIEEFLRFTGPTRSLARTTTREVELGGRTIPAGERVTLMFSSGSRDEAVFASPDECRFDRDASNHVTFGVGLHRCIGEHLVRRELRIALEVLLRRLPGFEVDGPTEPAVWPMRGYRALPLRFAAVGA